MRPESARPPFAGVPRIGVVADAALANNALASLRRCGSNSATPSSATTWFAYLRRCDCRAEELRAGLVQAEPPPRQGDRALARLELDAYLRVWRAMHPQTEAELDA